MRGNADRELVEAKRGELVPTDEPGPTRRWVVDRLRDGQAEALASWPLTVAVEVDGLGPTLFCHAVPRDDVPFFLETTPEVVAAEILGSVEERVVVCGHTHMQFDRRIGGVRVVNAGSIGMPYEDGPGAYWALLGPDVELRCTGYDLEAAAARIRAPGWERAEAFVRENVLTVPSRAEALAAFEPRVGRG